MLQGSGLRTYAHVVSSDDSSKARVDVTLPCAILHPRNTHCAIVPGICLRGTLPRCQHNGTLVNKPAIGRCPNTAALRSPIQGRILEWAGEETAPAHLCTA